VTLLAWIEVGALTALAGLFAFDSVRERQWRAAALAVVLPAPPILLLTCLLRVDVPGSDVVLGIASIGVLLGGAAVALPFGRGTHLRRTGRPRRVDERDALFHRFYRLEPGTAEFEAYYETHPEKRAFDDEVRALPHLSQPGARTFDRLASPMMDALDGVTTHLAARWQAETPVAPAADVSPDAAAATIKGFARHLGADLVGCTALDPAWIYSHVGRGAGEWGSPIELDHTHAVVVAVRMDHDMVRHAPDLPPTIETTWRYLQSAAIARVLTSYVTRLGFRARAHVDGDYQVMCVPVAADAGLGELGRLGLLVTRRFGPRVRLAVVTTDLPLEQDPPARFGVQEFCSRCLKCATCCPSRSVDGGDKAVHNGVERWLCEQDSCYRTWRRYGSDCAICVKVCPYSHPRSPSHDLVRCVAARNPLARALAVFADDLAYGRRPRGRFPTAQWFPRRRNSA